MSNKTSIAVLGAGSWGCTLAMLLAEQGQDVRLWGRSPELLQQIRTGMGPRGVPGLRLTNVRIDDDLHSAVSDARIVVLAVPAQATNTIAKQIAAQAPPIAVIASKGIELASHRLLTDVLAETLPQTVLVVLSGPCIAREVAARIPTSAVVASDDNAVAEEIQALFATPAFRLYSQRDIAGVEVGGAYKNVIAIAAGVCDGLGFGANSKSALLTRGLAEMTRFALAWGAEERTLSGLSGLGDLCVTCFSPHSRNRRFGELIGQGISPAEAAAAIGETVEGVATAEAIQDIAIAQGIEVPIAKVVNQMCKGQLNPGDAVRALMTRGLKEEFESA